MSFRRDSESSEAGEFSRLVEWERFFWLSRAYTEAAVVLCQNMLDGEFSSQYSSSRVILHLARHGVELFFKGALTSIGVSTKPFGHNLAALHSCYESHFTEFHSRFTIPEEFLAGGDPDLFPDTLREFHQTLDQRHRYPSSRSGEDFATPEIFDPVRQKTVMECLRNSLQVIEWVSIRPKVARLGN